MKGVLHTLEAVIAVMIILLGVGFVYPMREKPELSIADVGYKCLSSLDQEGLLKYYVSNDMTSSLNNSLGNCITPGIGFNFKMCDSAVCNPDSIPDDKEIFISSYLLIRINTYTFEIKEDELFYENFDNLRTELINTVDISLFNQDNVYTNLDDFIAFSGNVLKRRGFEEDVKYTVSINGNERTISMNISLKSDKSEILENLIINRRVYT